MLRVSLRHAHSAPAGGGLAGPVCPHEPLPHRLRASPPPPPPPESQPRNALTRIRMPPRRPAAPQSPHCESPPPAGRGAVPARGAAVRSAAPAAGDIAAGWAASVEGGRAADAAGSRAATGQQRAQVPPSRLERTRRALDGPDQAPARSGACSRPCQDARAGRAPRPPRPAGSTRHPIAPQSPHRACPIDPSILCVLASSLPRVSILHAALSSSSSYPRCRLRRDEPPPASICSPTSSTYLKRLATRQRPLLPPDNHSTPDRSLAQPPDPPSHTSYTSYTLCHPTAAPPSPRGPSAPSADKLRPTTLHPASLSSRQSAVASITVCGHHSLRQPLSSAHIDNLSRFHLH